jgi:hypothetical protein
MAAGAQGTITGVVRDTARRPLRDAEVMIVSPEMRVRTDSTGTFRITGLAAGTYEVRARRIGYFPAQTTVVLRGSSAHSVILELPSRPVMLDTVTVTSRCADRDYLGFLCRQKRGAGGVYMDVEQIDSAKPRFPADLFRRPGFRVEAATGRNGGLKVVPLTGWRCMRPLVNGRPPSVTNPVPAWPNSIVGLEIYANPDSIPAEYQRYQWSQIKVGRQMVNARCSLTVYWTSDRPRYAAGTRK